MILLSDGAVVSVVLLLAGSPRPRPSLSGDPTSSALAGGEWFQMAVVAMAAVLLSYGHYRRRVPFWIEARQVTTAALIGLLCSIFLSMHVAGDVSGRPRLHLVLAWLCVPPVIVGMRRAVRMLLGSVGLWQIDTLIAGEPARAAEVSKALRSDKSLGYRCAGTIDLETLGKVGSRAALDQVGATFLVIAPSAADESYLRTVNSELALGGLTFAVVPTQIAGAPVACPEAHYFMNSNLMLVGCSNLLDHPTARLSKAAFDSVLAGVLLLALLPLLLTIALLLWGDGGPALYAQTRIGANGRRFPCLKFRSMVVDSEAALQRTLASDPAAAAEWRENRKLANDPRITRIGRLLRRTSLDELPQLINVLRGEMSLVGPRPIVEAEVSYYGAAIDFYYRIKPGVTGLWQVSGRSSTSYTQRVEMDIWYVTNWRLWHDIAILFKTVTAVLGRRGAC